MQQIELTEIERDVLEYLGRIADEDAATGIKTAYTGVRGETDVVNKVTRVVLDRLEACGLVKRGFGWVGISAHGKALLKAIQSNAVPMVDPSAAQMVAALKERTAPLLRTANEQLLGQLYELQNIINGQDAELTALRQQYADQSDQLARCQEALKPFAKMYKNTPRHFKRLLAYSIETSLPTSASVTESDFARAYTTLNGGAK